MSKILLNHSYYNIELHGEGSILKLDWKKATIGMTDQDFKDCLLEYASLAQIHKIEKLWIDSKRYRYHTADVLMSWRKQTIIPKFQESGVKQIAFEVGVGGKMMPASVTETGLRTECFEKEINILEWLKPNE